MSVAISILPAATMISLAIWLVLLFGRNRFWRADQRLSEAGELAAWPDVVAVIPARNEAETIAATVNSLLGQDYGGSIHVIVVDDNSDDGTADIVPKDAAVQVVAGRPLAAGWTGKLWAVSQGVEAIGQTAPDAKYILFTDADIIHDPGNVRRLVYRAETDGRHLVSLMVMLRCKRFWERWMMPAFVFFFQKLYPFPAVNDPAKRIAAAAGGCMLVRRDSLQNAGGINAIKGELIDDCAMGRLIKSQGPIWLGLASRTRSLRAYEDLTGIWNMVARTAFVQLDHSVLALVGTVIGMVLIYVVPPTAVVVGVMTVDDSLLLGGGMAWLTMVTAYAPTLAHYGLSPFRGLALPAVATVYTLMTLSSAWRHWRGRQKGDPRQRIDPHPKHQRPALCDLGRPGQGDEPIERLHRPPRPRKRLQSRLPQH